MNKVEFELSDDLKVYCSDELPRDKRLFAAKGLIPIPPSKLALVLFKLTLDKDQEIVEEASNSLRDIPENVIETLVSDTSTHVGLLDFLAKQSFSENVLQHIVVNNNTEDETISFIAENVHSQPIIDAIANNHGRILRSGKIVESLSNNPVVSRSTLDRVLSFINLYLHKDAVDSPEFNKVQYDIDDPELRESVAAVENSFFDELDLSDELIDESDEDEGTRIELAFEKILLIAYLSNSIPDVVTGDVIRSEIVELIGQEDIDDFISGKNTGLTFDEVRTIVQVIEDQAPEPFRLVDRLLVNLMDNYEQFTTKNLYFTVSALTNQGSIKESSGAIVFFLNNTKNKNRKMNVRFRSDRDSIHPDRQEISITLDPQTDPYPKEQPEFIAEGDDILSILATLLQVGDAVWLRFKPKGFGFKVITIQAEEEGTGNVMGQSIEMKFTKSIGWYVSTFAPKLTAVGGLALPFLSTTLL